MDDTVISVEGVSKRYLLAHRAGGEPTSFREYVSGELRALAARLTGRRPPPREEFWALSDVSFGVRQGEVLGIVGRNGAGKSTLLKILSRITEPTKGRVRLRGRVASLLEVGTGFHPELTGRENIYLNGAILGMGRHEIRRKFDEIVAFAEIERFLDTPVKRYSSGMYVRLAFAVAAHLEPEILIVDEVLAVGDAAFQKKCLGKMGEISKGGGRTVLFVSHNMAAVSQLCSRAVWLKRGVLEGDGRPDEIVHRYMAADAEQVAERRWRYPGDAPGDDRVRLLGARVVQRGRSARVIDINEPTDIELEIEVLKRVDNLVTGASLYSDTGQCLTASCDWRPNRLMPGRYRKSVRIPGPSLAEGRINILVQAVFFDPSVQSVVVPEALSVDAIDSDSPRAVRGPYKGSWPGQMRLELEWTDAQAVRPEDQAEHTFAELGSPSEEGRR